MFRCCLNNINISVSLDSGKLFFNHRLRLIVLHERTNSIVSTDFFVRNAIFSVLCVVEIISTRFESGEKYTKTYHKKNH